MMYAQYQRIEARAGGVAATPREFVKACHSVLKKSGKGRDKRVLRHEWIRGGLKALEHYQQLVMRGRLTTS